jgi:hypothetical protein
MDRMQEQGARPLSAAIQQRQPSLAQRHLRELERRMVVNCRPAHRTPADHSSQR